MWKLLENFYSVKICFGQISDKNVRTFQIFSESSNQCDSKIERFLPYLGIFRYSVRFLKRFTSSSSSSSSCSGRIRFVPVPCILKMKLVPPSLPRSSYVSSSFWFILQCLFRYPVCVDPLYVLQPLFLVLSYFLYYILCSCFFPNT